ncbi:hypothetical protein TTHERM_00581480 (macronuclear) [Tetrahymena thermophila SB210]|uniref:Uncharacterized protein n=1 Tax=Tetrahymena thermophila (strain SB210) TaxID=312017 RepID=Q23QD5_TETTS|nr:hypothetical protein TTHERM_00581480 [Tetrahymena thermophila SB210]EAR98649.1 hypothetical protein TTHERM_00581480 [Tetrahymena thermophila SB210]|eukprot:XP_001018894.1 hypothetical protein TTHERM_00581480 [Tetrahymena thermophila SB210]
MRSNSLNSSSSNYQTNKLKEKYSHFFDNEDIEGDQKILSPQDLQSSNRSQNRSKRMASFDAQAFDQKKQETQQQQLIQEQLNSSYQYQNQHTNNNVLRFHPKTENYNHLNQQKIIKQNQDELNFLKEQFLNKVEEIQSNLKSIDPYKISLNSIHSNTNNFNQTYIKRQEELNANILQINQLFDKQNFLDSAGGSQEIKKNLQQYNNDSDQNIIKNSHQNRKPPFAHPAGESSIVKTKINQNDFFDESHQNNTTQKQEMLQIQESTNAKNKDLKDKSLLEILKKKENLYEKAKRDYNLIKQGINFNYQKDICNGGSKDPYKNYSRDSLDRQKIYFYDSFMPSNMRMMKSPYQLLKYKINSRAKFDIQNCIQELSSINSSLRSTNYK